MSQIVLNAQLREDTGKKAAKTLRREGKVPCVYYANNEKSVSLTVDEKELHHFLSLSSGLIDVSIDKKKPKKCILRQIQFDPVKNNPIHLDIMGVKLEEKLNVSVPVRLTGDPVGVKEEGGTLMHSMHEVEISCLPLDIPEFIEVDVSELKVGDSIHIKDLITDKIEIMNDPEVVVANVAIVRVTVPEVSEEVEVEGEEGVEGEEAAEEAGEAKQTEDESE